MRIIKNHDYFTIYNRLGERLGKDGRPQRRFLFRNSLGDIWCKRSSKNKLG